MSKIFKWNMFFTSFLPLWFSIAIFDAWNIVCYSLKYIPSHPQCHKDITDFISGILLETITICVLIICSFISIHGINKEIREQEKNPAPARGTITRAKRANKLTAEFLLAYILPMIAFDYGELKQITLFIVYFAVLSFLCIRNSNVYTNILLEFKGYKMYDCDIECNRVGERCTYTDCLVISKNNLTQSLPHEVKYFDFENYIYIEIGV
jgi:hypothetical protein